MLKKAFFKEFALALLLMLSLSACNKSGQATVLSPAETGSVTQFANAENSTVESSNADIEQAYEAKRSDVQVSGSGKVVKLLADDTHGARHQKFLVRINARQTLLFAHNIDLAERIPLQVGDEITFSGEYVYNPKGGIMHWTHLDPHGHHSAGWIELHGKKYQ